MPDVVVVGGGIIGTACAFELARAGASVTLLEKDELAAGASGRNLGYLDTSKDPVLAPLARASLDRYLELGTDPPSPFFLDRAPIGTLAITIDEDEVEELEAWAAAAAAVGVPVERVGASVRELEPELSPDVVDAYLLHEGHRVDPLALTVSYGALARSEGATIRHHAPARRLVERGDRVVGVTTDDGVLEADVVVLAAGPWSSALARPLGIRLPVASARGWLVHAAPERPLFRHWVQSGARRLLRGEAVVATEPGPLLVSMREFGEGLATRDIAPMIQPAPDGSILTGTSREPSFAADAYDLEVPRIVAAQAARLVPALADAPVLSTWSGVRPVSPDERPMLGWARDGLFVATGHGSEGVILGAGSAELVAALVVDGKPAFDPAPFDPMRFEQEEA
ncbi:MAG TPA: FAD-binding oxidoreductase [Actinomycetota bacterium]|nr:FAD-binding oxidoreductase [Actinomycetota bacterium]